MGFDHRIAVVTGASGGIGKAVVRRLLGGGASVMLAGLHLDRLDAVAADLGLTINTGYGMPREYNIISPSPQVALMSTRSRKPVSVSTVNITPDAPLSERTIF